MKKPRNILLSIADDQRWDMVGSVGDNRVLTPNFDKLAGRGTAFRNARCQNGPDPAVCIPSRAAIHTGRQVAETDLQCAGYPTLGEVLLEAGYETHLIGKWHNGRESCRRSFSGGARIFLGGMHDHCGMPLHDFDPSGRYENPKRCDKFSSVAFADSAIDFLENHQAEKPFFLCIGWTSPHDPRTPPAEFSDLYDVDQLELPPNFLPCHPFDNGELRVRDEMLAGFPRHPDEIRQHLADYFGMVSELDARWGRVLDALESRGFSENTLVIHTADHGLSVGQHGLMGKQNLYEHSVRVPLLMAGPEIPAGRREEGLCYNFDITPTILEWAEVPVPETMTAQSLIPVLNGSSPARPFVTAWYRSFQRSVTDGRWKLIDCSVSKEIQLFDLQADPWEMVNLASIHPEIVIRLESQLPEIPS